MCAICDARAGGATLEEALVQTTRQALENVAKFGTNVTHVYGGEDSLEWTYTAGLSAADQPELAILGLPQQLAHPLLNAISARVLSDSHPLRLKDGDELVGVITTGAVRFRAIDPLDEERPFAVARTLFGDEITALQVVWPDRNGNFPGDPGFNVGQGSHSLLMKEAS